MDAPDRTIDAVTVVIPTYNEANHIDAVLAGVAAQTFDPNQIEVLVIDGGSSDATVERASSHIGSLPNLRVMDNPRRHQSAALNIGLAAASHEFIVRMDAHTTYEKTYVAACVAAYEDSDAVMVGGPMRPEGLTRFGKAVALATTTPIGVGPGRFHYSEVREYADTVYLGAFRRSDVIAVGGYDERSLWGEDHELAFRLTKAGGRILLDPAIRSTYFPRSKVRRLSRQYRRYGIGKTITLKKHGNLPTWRPLAPAALVLGLALSTVGCAFSATRLLAAGFVALYVVAMAIAALITARGRPIVAARVLAAFVTMHLSYGVGFWYGLIRLVFVRGPERASS
jgi:glycosyltransferase involved in cell wall biosynthesis